MSATLTPPPTGCSNVRDVVAAIVTLAVAPYGGQVFRARTYPLKQAAFPAILVYGWDETLTFVSDNPSHYQATDICQMMVHVLVNEADPEAAELALELLIAAIRTQVIQSQALLGDDGAIEGIVSVKTTRQIKAESDDVLGEAHIVFEMRWSEVYWLRDDPITEIDVIISEFCRPVLRMNIGLAAPPAVPDPDACPDPFPPSATPA